MAKSREAFRTISEVSDWLNTPAHVLRFWESRFNQIKPVKRAGGRRYYRPSDMALLGGIKRLLHDDGITIKGVQKILREKGLKYVSSLSQLEIGEDADQPAKDTNSRKTEETPIEAILNGETVSEENERSQPVDDLGVAETHVDPDDPEDEPVSVFHAVQTETDVEIREKIASIFADPDSGISVEQDDTSELETVSESEPEQAPESEPEDEPEPVSQALETLVLSDLDEAPEPVDAPIAVVHTDKSGTPEERIVALYHRLSNLRNRMRAEMEHG